MNTQNQHVECNVTCPWCSRKNELATGVSDPGAMPGEGDMTLCIDCGNWSIFTDGPGLRKPDPEEARRIVDNKDCVRAFMAWQRVKGKK